MSDVEAFVVGGVMAGSALIGALRKVLERRRARKELRSRPALGTETDEGTVVRVTGIVRVAERTLTSPLAGAECVMYRSRVLTDGGFVRRAFKPRETFAMVPFMLERVGEPAVAVEGTTALLDLSGKLPKPRGSDDYARRAKFLAIHGLADQGGVFEEVVITPGMRISIAGLMMKDLREPDPDALYRDGPLVAPRIVGDSTHPLVIGSE